MHPSHPSPVVAKRPSSAVLIHRSCWIHSLTEVSIKAAAAHRVFFLLESVITEVNSNMWNKIFSYFWSISLFLQNIIFFHMLIYSRNDCLDFAWTETELWILIKLTSHGLLCTNIQKKALSMMCSKKPHVTRTHKPSFTEN